MTEIELNEEFKIIKDVEDEIKNLKEKRGFLVDAFLKKLPFQSGDKVVNKNGEKFIIACLIDVNHYVNGIYVDFSAHKIKKNGEPYSTTVSRWCVGDYFSLKKVDE